MLYPNYFSSIHTLSLLLWLVPTSLSQLALASSSYLSPSLDKAGIGIRDTHFRSLFTEVASNPPKKVVPVVYESEIAAIFKGVAYGTTTQPQKSTTTTTTPPPTTTPSTTIAPSEPDVFIGQQKEVRINVDLAPDFVTVGYPDTDYPMQKKVPTAFTYLINSQVNNVEEEEEENQIQNVFPSPEPIEGVHVELSRAIKKEEFLAIQQEIQAAWGIHVYATAALFTIMAVACLALLTRAQCSTQMLPRGYFITLHMMVFIASFLRAVLYFYDPFGAYEKLPQVLTALLYNTTTPCLTSIYAVLFLVILRACKIHMFPAAVQSPLTLAVICGVHIGSSIVVDIISGVVEDGVSHSLNSVVQCITVVWIALLCLTYAFSFSSIQKAVAKHKEDFIRLSLGISNIENGKALFNARSRPSLTYAARLFFFGFLFQIFICVFTILSLTTDKFPITPSSSEAWAWWIQNSLERLSELFFCGLVLATAFCLTQSSSTLNANKNETDIFSIFKHYRHTTVGAKNIASFPDKCNILSNGSLISSSLNSSTLSYPYADWKKNNIDDKMKTGLGSINEHFQTQIYADDKYQKSLYAPANATNTYCSKQWKPQMNDFKYFPQSYAQSLGEKISPSAPNNLQAAYMSDIRHLDLVRSSNPRYENDYEVASYYQNSPNTHVYTKPYNTVSADTSHTCQHKCSSKSELSGCSSHSEIHVDYLTDESVDGLGTIPRSVTIPQFMQNPNAQRPQTLVFNKSCVSSLAMPMNVQRFGDHNDAIGV